MIRRGSGTYDVLSLRAHRPSPTTSGDVWSRQQADARSALSPRKPILDPHSENGFINICRNGEARGRQSSLEGGHGSSGGLRSRRMWMKGYQKNPSAWAASAAPLVSRLRPT